MYKLRELGKDDIKTINLWRNNPELVALLGAPYRYIDISVDYAWYENYMKSRATTVRCVILEEKTSFPIGLISLTGIDHINQSADLHIMIGDKENQGKGAGTFATREMLIHAFNNLNLQRVELTVLASNLRAQKMYERIGFVKEGVKRKARFKNGHFEDSYIYSILRDEFMS